MRARKNPGETTSTAKAVGIGVIVVAAFWLVFGAITYYVLAPTSVYTAANKLPPADPTGRMVDASQPLDHVTFRNYRLVPIGRPLALDKNKLAWMGLTREGYGLWAQAPESGGRARIGGGGGPNVPRAVPNATGPVYLRTTDGHYWQVLQK